MKYHKSPLSLALKSRATVKCSTVTAVGQVKERPVLALDLDETLVHAVLGETDRVPDFDFHVRHHHIKIFKRPHVDEFLQACSKFYRIVIYTASVSSYADRVIDHLDPTGTLVSQRLYREHCEYLHPFGFTKDVAKCHHDLSRVVLVDNSRTSFNHRVDNGILVRTWTHDKDDRELKHLGEFLVAVQGVDDLRHATRHYW